MKLVIFILSILFCFSYFNSSAQKQHSSYISLKKLESSLKDQGVKLLEPYNDQGRMCKSAAGRSLHIYFNKDTVTEVKMNIAIKSDREDIKKHFPVFLPIVNIIDSAAASWLQQELINNTDRSSLRKNNIINNQYYVLRYFPDLQQDLLNIGVFYKEPSFFRN